MCSFDLIVIGGGSGGAGAALTAGRAGVRTLWVEREPLLGGTGVNAFVNVWQPTYSASELAPKIAGRLLDRGDGCCVAAAFDTPSGRPIYRRNADAGYADTLRRWQSTEPRVNAPGFVYQPLAMDAVLREMAAETGHVTLWAESTFLDVDTAPSADGLRRVTRLLIDTPNGVEVVEAGFIIDATADIAVARRAGCAWTMGRESVEEYGEPSAPPQREFKLNGWTLCFLAHRSPDLVELPKEGYGNASDWAHIGEMPDGRLYVNVCFQFPGEVGWMLGPELARERALRNIARRWPGIKRAYGLEDWGIAAFAPRIGVREGPRLVGRYVLTEQDYRTGRFGAHHGDCIAFTDHAIDRHAPDGGCSEAVNGPAGIPFRCLQPREVDNLLVACRGAGFSSLAASAARLQRTMVELGEAAARFAATGKVIAPELPPYRG
ncbi:MAG: FAD-dependent oxidoreductase [Armatimonadota bacterium]